MWVKQKVAVMRVLAVSAVLVPLVGCSQAPQQVDCADIGYELRDPLEPVNRKVFTVNRVADEYVMQPLARGYGHLPQPVQDGVHNFAANFAEPKVLVNDVLQGNGQRALNTLGRFTVNTILGVAGVFDTAGRMGLPHHDADFGQTFGVWGIGAGPILEWPLLGSANSRDSVGRVANFMFSPFGGGNSDTVAAISTANTVGSTVDQRAAALPLTDRLETGPDYYSALRDHIAGERARRLAEGRAGQVDAAQRFGACELAE
ncbi:MAG: VacJ family lipoprotein [Pseudomonas sp.]|uniref:MlaA family lipoprotein n=1 Tax=Pseudomonas sp. TaxID=306 RepID=UPI0030F0BCB9